MVTTSPFPRTRRTVCGYDHHSTPSLSLPFPEKEGMCMEMITNPSLSQKRKPPIPFFAKKGTTCLAMVTTSPFSRRGRSVYVYDHHHQTPLPKGDKVSGHGHNQSHSQKRKPPLPFFRKRKWMSDHGHPHPLPFPEKEGMCMDMITTTSSFWPEKDKV